MVRSILPCATCLPSTESVPVPLLPMPGPSYLKSNVMVCLPGASLLVRGHAVLVLRLIGERVVELRLAVDDEQRPAAEASALRDEHAFGAALRNLDFGGDGERTCS